jgi:hypothetical protein
MAPRKALPVDIKRLVLHEAGYKCGNPVCRTILTLDVHHLQPVAEGGGNGPANLLALCPNCHTLHHHGTIPAESLRAWKMLLLAVNEAFDRKSVDLLLALAKTPVFCAGEGVLECAALIASGLAESHLYSGSAGALPIKYSVSLTDRGRAFVAAWKQGDQSAAVSGPAPNGSTAT